jgi:hypothetical protein
MDDEELAAAAEHQPKKTEDFRGWRVAGAADMRATRLFGGGGGVAAATAGAKKHDWSAVASALAPSDFPAAFHSNRGGGHGVFEPRGVWRRGAGAPAAPSVATAAPSVGTTSHDCLGTLIAAVRDSFRISSEVASIVENGIKLLPLEEVAERPYSPHTPTYDDGSPYDPVAEAAAEAARAAAAAKKDEL